MALNPFAGFRVTGRSALVTPAGPLFVPLIDSDHSLDDLDFSLFAERASFLRDYSNPFSYPLSPGLPVSPRYLFSVIPHADN